MRGLTSNFVSNSINSPSVKVGASVGCSYSVDGVRKYDPMVDLTIKQWPEQQRTTNNKRYTVEMTPDEARALAQSLIENADQADAACRRPEPEF